MKRFILAIAVLAMGICASAQQKGELSMTGALLLSGGNSLSQYSDGNNSVTSKTASPFSFDFGVGIGYFITNHTEISLGLYYGLDRERNEYCTTENNFYDSKSSFTIKPEIAYYAPLGSDRFFWKPAVELGFGFNSQTEQVSKETTNKVKQPFDFTAGLDIIAFEIRPSKHLAFDFSFGGLYYKNSSMKVELAEMVTRTVEHRLSFGFNNVFSPEFGVKYIF